MQYHYLVLGAAATIASAFNATFAQERPVLGEMKASEAAYVLERLGDKAKADEVRRSIELGKRDVQFSKVNWVWSREPEPYQFTQHHYGFIEPQSSPSDQAIEIKEAGNIQPDASLKGARIKITLDRLRVFRYPGGGVHQVLFDFYGQHQTTTASEDIHFSQLYRAQEGQGAGITGYPIFVGLQVGSEGVKFRCRTVNVKNEDDEKVVQFLNSDPFKNGLQLINSTNPLTPIVSSFATGLIEAFARRDENVPVQNFDMGLDFSSIASRAKLREGSYIAVQAPDAVWDWKRWRFNTVTGQVVSKEDATKTIPLNYVVFSISRLHN